LIGASAIEAATSSIPVVFAVAVDPVEFGLVSSLNRPGGNLTGVTILSVELGPKLMQLAHELAPAATVMALLVNPTSPYVESVTRDAMAAARTLECSSTSCKREANASSLQCSQR